MIKKITFIIILLLLIFFGWWYFSDNPSSYTEEECLTRGAKIVTLSDQLSGFSVDGKVLGNIKNNQNGSLCVMPK